MPETVRIKDIPESELTPEQAKVFNDLAAGRGRIEGAPVMIAVS